MAEDWKIQRDRKACEKPGCPLPTSQSYMAVLEWPACVRRDLCDACFQDYERRCQGAEPPIFWRAKRKQKGSNEPVLDLNSLRMLFDRLGSVDDDKAKSLRYFCALLLLRKRVLRMVQPRTAAEERADLVVVDPKQKELPPVLLFAPNIDLDNLGAMKEELLAALGEGDGEAAAEDGHAAGVGASESLAAGERETLAAPESALQPGAADMLEAESEVVAGEGVVDPGGPAG
ncbi:MAG: hypothetical protein RL398_1761 [Planctomycetota bacterium]|jgi:hypothetical protein